MLHELYNNDFGGKAEGFILSFSFIQFFSLSMGWDRSFNSYFAKVTISFIIIIMTTNLISMIFTTFKICWYVCFYIL